MKPYIALLTLLLQDSTIVTFEFWSEFILSVQRDDASRHAALQQMFVNTRVPSLLNLRLRNTWWMGDRQQWASSIEDFPIKGKAPIPTEGPLQAATLMTVLGCHISDVLVTNTSDLVLHLLDGRSLTVQGIGGEWEDSWFLELPVDDPDREKWSLVCDSAGLIGGRYPNRDGEATLPDTESSWK